jgi:hypothetical protein
MFRGEVVTVLNHLKPVVYLRFTFFENSNLPEQEETVELCFVLNNIGYSLSLGGFL